MRDLKLALIESPIIETDSATSRFSETWIILHVPTHSMVRNSRVFAKSSIEQAAFGKPFSRTNSAVVESISEVAFDPRSMVSSAGILY